MGKTSYANALRAALWGAGGAGAAVVLYHAISDKKGVTHWEFEESLGFALAIAGVLFWRWAVEPAVEARLHGEHTPGHGSSVHPSRRPLRALQSAFVAVVTVEAAVELMHGELRHNTAMFFSHFCLPFVVCGAVTLSWAAGAKRTPPRAALFGFLSGAGVCGALLFGFIQLFGPDVIIPPEGFPKRPFRQLMKSPKRIPGRRKSRFWPP
jgi:hypothetical protein